MLPILTPTIITPLHNGTTLDMACAYNLPRMLGHTPTTSRYLDGKTSTWTMMQLTNQYRNSCGSVAGCLRSRVIDLVDPSFCTFEFMGNWWVLTSSKRFVLGVWCTTWPTKRHPMTPSVCSFLNVVVRWWWWWWQSCYFLTLTLTQTLILTLTLTLDDRVIVLLILTFPL